MDSNSIENNDTYKEAQKLNKMFNFVYEKAKKTFQPNIQT